MYELIQAGPQSFYIQSPAKIGIYKQSETEVYLIDSGSDKDAGKKCKRILEEQGWKCKGILSTHSNADHVGGNAYLQNQFGCKVFAEGIEASITEHPVLEPAFLFGGYPYKDLRHKFLMAQPSKCSGFDDPDFPSEVKVIQLPGHFFDMVGYVLPDGTAFVADCLSSPETIEKYGISFIYDVASYLQTLETVSALGAKLYVPSHAQPCTDIAPLAEINRAKVVEIADHIESLCSGRLFEEILQQVFKDYGLTMTHEQYVLIGSTVRSYLAYLADAGRVVPVIDDSRILWTKTE